MEHLKSSMGRLTNIIARLLIFSYLVRITSRLEKADRYILPSTTVQYVIVPVTNPRDLLLNPTVRKPEKHLGYCSIGLHKTSCNKLFPKHVTTNQLQVLADALLRWWRRR